MVSSTKAEGRILGNRQKTINKNIINFFKSFLLSWYIILLINGESIGQVASQTLDSMVCINNVTNMPVIRPVACFDKLEIIDIAKKIGTYDTSILPYEDCCTIFVPKHPVIKPTLEKCIKYENNFDYHTLINQAVNNIETITNFKEDEFEELL